MNGEQSMESGGTIEHGIKSSEYENDFEEYPAVGVHKYNQDKVNQDESKELGTLSWTWTPLSRDALFEANDALVVKHLNAPSTCILRSSASAL